MDNIIPKTAGRFVTEEELRAFAKCSQFHFYSGKVTLSDKLKLVQTAYEKIILHCIREFTEDITTLLVKYVVKAIRDLKLSESYLSAEIQTLTRTTILLLGEIFRTLSPKKYIPVYSVFEYITKVGKTPIELRVSSVLRHRENQTIHIVVFSPYQRPQDIKADPIHSLQLNTLATLGNKNPQVTQPSMLHIFALDEDELIYQEYRHVPGSKTKDRITDLIKDLEQGHRYPLVPCPYKCPFKLKCKVE